MKIYDIWMLLNNADYIRVMGDVYHMIIQNTILRIANLCENLNFSRCNIGNWLESINSMAWI